jgi:hypothetical protein
MRISFALLAVLSLAFAPGCKKGDDKKKEAPQAEPQKEEPAPKADEPTEEPADEAPNMANKMANCPSAVEGATTAVEDGEGVVIVTVTSDDEAKMAEIRKRATTLAGLNSADSTEVKHSGQRTGGGGLGRCPVVLDNVEVTAEDVDKGTKITLKPKDAAKLADLSKAAKERAEALKAGGHVHGSGTGGGDGSGRDPMKGDTEGTGGGEATKGDEAKK